MGQIELFDKYMETIQRLYSFKTILAKAKGLFTNGAFTRSGGKISGFTKIRLTAIILKEYLFTTNKDKRELLFFLTGLIREKKIVVDKAFSFMLSMLSSHRQVKSNMQNMEHYRSLIRKNDIGPWKDKIITHHANE
jgi:hypothetical protein